MAWELSVKLPTEARRGLNWSLVKIYKFLHHTRKRWLKGKYQVLSSPSIKSLKFSCLLELCLKLNLVKFRWALSAIRRGEMDIVEQALEYIKNNEQNPGATALHELLSDADLNSAMKKKLKNIERKMEESSYVPWNWKHFLDVLLDLLPYFSVISSCRKCSTLGILITWNWLVLMRVVESTHPWNDV